MDTTTFYAHIKKILNEELPDSNDVISDGLSIADEINIGRTLFFDQAGVDSEAEYKRTCMKDNRIMFHAHIGLNSWEATAGAMNFLYNSGQASGISIERAEICLDRSMGLPGKMRANIPAETGPVLTSNKWDEIGQVVPIQPHMGDFMIGFPAGTVNTVNALKAGVTTIGNLSQFFAHQMPHWQDHAYTAGETIKAISILSAFRERGVMLHSYLEDGYGALFTDCSTIAGWALLEKYIVEDLLDAKLSHCIGGLTTDPLKRAGWIFALDEIHDNDSVGSMIYGDTISFTGDTVVNRAIIGEYLLWDIMSQLECPTGHAVNPLPVTESFRIPATEEIFEAQLFGKRVEHSAKRLYPYIDLSASRDFAETVINSGRSVFRNALDGLSEGGVDIRDPVKLLYVLKKLGPAAFENMFGAGVPDTNCIRSRRPVILTDVFKASDNYLQESRKVYSVLSIEKQAEKRKLLIASTDVHEHAILIIDRLMKDIGMETIYLGAEQDTDQVTDAAVSQKPDMILISTHNGMAGEYASRLKKNLGGYNIDIPIVFGGVLNQKVEGKDLPVDIAQDLKELEIYPATDLCSLPAALLRNKSDAR